MLKAKELMGNLFDLLESERERELLHVNDDKSVSQLGVFSAHHQLSLKLIDFISIFSLSVLSAPPVAKLSEIQRVLTLFLIAVDQ